MLRVVAYDVSSPGRLRRMARICLDYGVRVEKSLFECDLDFRDFAEMWRRLQEVADRDEDALVSYPLCAECAANVARFGTVACRDDASVKVF